MAKGKKLESDTPVEQDTDQPKEGHMLAPDYQKPEK
jgi:hypothetical protein